MATKSSFTRVHRAVLLAVAIAFGLLFFSPAHSDHWSQAHIGPLNHVNYWPIVGDVIRVCDESNNLSTTTVEEGLAIWNAGVHSITGRDIMAGSCSNPGVRLQDLDNCGDCGPGSVACAEYPDTDAPQERRAWFCDQADQKHYVAHELGHGIGFDEDPDNCAIMDSCSAQYLYPIDQTRFEHAYTPDAVASLSGYSTFSPPYVLAVNLSWNPAPVHSEKEFEVLNRTNGYYYRATEPKNDNASSFVESAYGWIWYDVETRTDAKSYPFGDANWVQVEVGVASPTNVALSLYPGGDDLRLTWTDDSEKEGWYEARLRRNGAVHDTKTLDSAPGRGSGMAQQWYDEPAGTYTGEVRACSPPPAFCSDWVASGSVNVALGSIHFIVKTVDNNGYVLGNLAGATALLTDTSGNPLYPAQTSDSGGWVRFNDVPPGTYGILAYKTGYIGKAKQDGHCGASQYTTSGATIYYGGYTAAWDNSVPVNGGSITYCHDLGLSPPAAPTNVTITQNYGGNPNRIRFCWTDNSNNENKFQFRQWGYWTSYTYVTDLSPNTTCFTSTYWNDAWHFCVRSVGAEGQSLGWVSVTRPTSTNVYFVNVPCSQTYCRNSGNTSNTPHQH